MLLTHQFWYNLTSNFGDALAPVIVRAILGRDLPRAENGESYATLISLGSVLHVAGHFEEHLIWGTGFEPAYGKLKFRKLNVAAVRGPMTQKVAGVSTVPWGDPALLMPRIVQREPTANGGIILVPHHTSYRWARYLPMKVVNPLDHWSRVLDEILDAKFVWCEAMHAAILATAFGVPWAWWQGRHGGRASFKWADWFGSIGVEPRAFPLWRLRQAQRWAAQTKFQVPDADDLIASFIEHPSVQKVAALT